MKKNKNKGFTIVELIVVMAIIAILILIAVPAFTKYIDRAKRTSEMGTASTINKSYIATISEHYVTYKPTGEFEYMPDGWIYGEELAQGIKSGVSGKEKLFVSSYENLEDFYTNDISKHARWDNLQDYWIVLYSMEYEYSTHISTTGEGPFVMIAPNIGGKRNVYENGKYAFNIDVESSVE